MIFKILQLEVGVAEKLRRETANDLSSCHSSLVPDYARILVR